MTERRRVPVGDDGAPALAVEAGAESCDCPRLDADEWDGVESDWSDIAFVAAKTKSVMGVPVGYDKTRTELFERARDMGATVPDDPMLLLGGGQFSRPVMLEVEDVPDTPGIVRPGGRAYTRIVNAPLGSISKVLDRVVAEAQGRYGAKPRNTWLWYLTCRVCSAERNYETLVVAHYPGEAGQ